MSHLRQSLTPGSTWNPSHRLGGKNLPSESPDWDYVFRPRLKQPSDCAHLAAKFPEAPPRFRMPGAEGNSTFGGPGERSLPRLQ